MIRTTSRVDQRYDGAGPGRSMLAFRSVVSVLVRALGDLLYELRATWMPSSSHERATFVPVLRTNR